MIESAAARLLRAEWGGGQRVASYRPLTQRLAVVARVETGGPPAPATVILKHVPETRFRFGPASPEFAGELVSHRLFAELGAEAGIKPALLVYDPRGVLVLEDLGSERDELGETFAEWTPRLASAFARLHAATLGRTERYAVLWHETGIEDTRHYSAARQACRFRRAIEVLGRNDLAWVSQIVEQPDAWTCLIHDDLAKAAQTFQAGGRLLLLDFEESKLGHPLLDLVRPMLGRFHIDRTAGVYLWTCPMFGLDLAEEYRACLAELSGRSMAEAEWRRSLNAALIYCALTLTGEALEFPPGLPLVGTVQQNIKGILQRVSDLSGALGGPNLSPARTVSV